MRHRGRAGYIRWIFRVITIVLWIGVVCLALELYAWMRAPKNPPAPDSIPFSFDMARDIYGDIYQVYGAQDPMFSRPYPGLNGFEATPEAGREQIARARLEWLVLVDGGGQIRQVYGALPGAGSTACAPALGSGLSGCCPPPFSEKTAAAVREALGGKKSEELSIDMPDASGDLFRLKATVYPCGQEALIALRPSIWVPDKKRFARGISVRRVSEGLMMESFSTNQRGFRGVEAATPKPSGVIRIVCLGGSTTVEGFMDGLTYPALLERFLSEAYAGSVVRIEVVNAGIFGLNSEDERGMGPEILAMEPDILIYYNFINDLSIGLDSWMRRAETWPGLTGSAKACLRKTQFGRRYLNVPLLPTQEALREYYRGTVLSNLRTLFSEVQSAGVEVVVCSFAGLIPDGLSSAQYAYADGLLLPQLFENLNLASYTYLRRIFNEELFVLSESMQVRTISVAERLDGGFRWFMDLCHLNPRGIEKKARIIADGLSPYLAERMPGAR